MAQTEKAPPEGILPLIQLASDLIGRRLERYLIAKHGLTMPQYQLLLAAAQSEGATLGSLSEQLDCSRGNITGIVDRLERDDWLRRERSREDRRVITVRLTEKGEKVHEIAAELAEQMRQLLGAWEPDQRQVLQESLTQLCCQLRA